MRRVLVIYGTRPEAIKMAPVVEAMRRCRRELSVRVCATAQHREMLDQVHSLFGLDPDFDLGWMRPNQSLNALSSLAFASLDRVVEEQAPDWILVQGDTTTAMVATMVGFHRRVRVGHVEAGLRTGDLARPFPEEANRRIIDLVAEALFAPTELARRALLAEGVAEERIFLTGNTVVDALLRIADQVGEVPAADQVLVTAHRRESFGQPLREIFGALRELAEAFPAIRWVYPVHRNPNVTAPAREILAELPNVELHPPFDYLELVRRLRASRLVLTDSGGIQEEAPTFGKPVLVLRDTTERPEGIAAGVARLVGTERQRIVAETRRLLTDPAAYEAMAKAINPYGDGRAAERIAAIVCGRRAEEFCAD
ncbi:MAG: UDP-N-acetylglucosamine 2-epimerase (non-hydrolyzing) [bacterium]|nr:UDP-N-acetylglucosamine 2-epimerase (non-hydrolyzing) [bacterium]